MKSALIFLAAWHLAISDAARRSSRAATVASGLFPKPEVAAVTGVPAFAQLVLASQQRVQGEEEKEAEECHMWLSHPLSSFSAGDIEKELKVKEVTEAEHIPYQGISKGNALAPDTPVTPETFQARFLKPPLDTGEENKISSLDFIKFLLLDVAADGDILANAWSKAKKIFVAGKWYDSLVAAVEKKRKIATKKKTAPTEDAQKERKEKSENHLRGLCLHKKWITDAQAQTGAWFRQCFEDRKAVLNTCVQKSIATVRSFLIPDVINMVRRHNAPALNKINAGQAGSEDPTSDIDLNQDGVNTEDMTKEFNDAFRKISGQESGSLVDVNLYAMDYLSNYLKSDGMKDNWKALTGAHRYHSHSNTLTMHIVAFMKLRTYMQDSMYRNLRDLLRERYVTSVRDLSQTIRRTATEPVLLAIAGNDENVQQKIVICTNRDNEKVEEASNLREDSNTSPQELENHKTKTSEFRKHCEALTEQGEALCAYATLQPKTHPEVQLCHLKPDVFDAFANAALERSAPSIEQETEDSINVIKESFVEMRNLLMGDDELDLIDIMDAADKVVKERDTKVGTLLKDEICIIKKQVTIRTSTDVPKQDEDGKVVRNDAAQPIMVNKLVRGPKMTIVADLRQEVTELGARGREHKKLHLANLQLSQMCKTEHNARKFYFFAEHKYFDKWLKVHNDMYAGILSSRKGSQCESDEVVQAAHGSSQANRDKRLECNMQTALSLLFANEPMYSEGAVIHVVTVLQMGRKWELPLNYLFDSFTENLGDFLKEAVDPTSQQQTTVSSLKKWINAAKYAQRLGTAFNSIADIMNFRQDPIPRDYQTCQSDLAPGMMIKYPIAGKWAKRWPTEHSRLADEIPNENVCLAEAPAMSISPGLYLQNCPEQASLTTPNDRFLPQTSCIAALFSSLFGNNVFRLKKRRKPFDKEGDVVDLWPAARKDDFRNGILSMAKWDQAAWDRQAEMVLEKVFAFKLETSGGTHTKEPFISNKSKNVREKYGQYVDGVLEEAAGLIQFVFHNMHNAATKEIKREAKTHVTSVTQVMVERIQALKSLASNLEASISEPANQESRADSEASDSNSQASSPQTLDAIATPSTES